MDMVLILVLATIATFLLIELAYRMWSRRAKEKAGEAVPAMRTALLPGALPRQGEKAFTVVQGNKKIDFVSPLDGIVCSVNDDVNADTGRLKKDPYRSSWLLAAMPSNIAQNIKKLKIAGDAAAWLERELMVFLEFITLHRAMPEEVGVTMQDGGHCIEGVMEKIDGELLQLLVRKFFR